MFNLIATNTIQGIAGAGSSITYTISGMELTGTTSVYKIIAQGQLAASAGAIYTVGTSITAFIKRIDLVNVTAGAITGIKLFLNGSAVTNQVSPTLTIPAYGCATFDNTGWKIYDQNGLQIKTTYVSKNIGTLSAPVATSGTGETKIFNLAIPANSVKVGDSFFIECFGISSSTGTLIFRVRAGANGTTGDNQAWISITSAAQVANQRAGFSGVLTVRSIGSGGTCQCECVGYAQAATLPTVVAAVATAAINTTGIWYVDIDCTCSVGTWTCQEAVICPVQ